MHAGSWLDCTVSDRETQQLQEFFARKSYEVDIQSLWAKYEDIAMHFNDLLMKLRTQALAGIAAISTLVGIFTKADPASVQSDWLIATGIFGALAVFWLAICCLDLFYYNRLLVGAVTALKDLEAEACAAQFTGIKMSTEIIAEFDTWLPSAQWSFLGVYVFYGIVFLVIAAAAVFSWHMHLYTASLPPATHHARHLFRPV